MRLRTRRLLHRYKKIWLAFLGWAAASLAVLLLFGWALSDHDGGLGRIQPAASWSLEAKDIDRLAISARGLRVEIAASVDNGKIRAYLYGDGYAGEQVRLYQEGGTAVVALAQQPPVADSGLSLRIVVPKRDYAQIQLTLPETETRLVNLRGDLLIADMTSGRLQMDKLDIKEAKVTSQTADVAVKDCAVNSFQLASACGDTTVARSNLRYFTYDAGSGDLLIQHKTIDGIWQLASDAGDITVRTRRTPYNLLAELASDRGQVSITYAKYDWDELIAQRAQPRYFQGIVGEGSRMLLAKSVKGNILVEQQ